ncbi:hypothetical protein [Arthrobacter sp. efr-133-R2A-120]|uniref:hypothetical protein n=1 Tax=Arthrobacter sp. efr-133-R2A-120 TaxID=3040277 RepID=UPI00254D0B94|nr:hypothetical protein [Arthrobacter sp. efr-133-R2A-120]
MGATSANSTATAPRSLFLEDLILRFKGSPWVDMLPTFAAGKVNGVLRRRAQHTAIAWLPGSDRSGEAAEKGVQVAAEKADAANNHKGD